MHFKIPAAFFTILVVAIAITPNSVQSSTPNTLQSDTHGRRSGSEPLCSGFPNTTKPDVVVTKTRPDVKANGSTDAPGIAAPRTAAHDTSPP
jgi:hypothetical protein